MEQLRENTLPALNQQELQNVTGGFRFMYPGQGLGQMILESILGAYQQGYDDAQDHCDC